MENNIHVNPMNPDQIVRLIVDENPFKPSRRDITGALMSPLLYLEATTQQLNLDRCWVEANRIERYITLFVNQGQQESFIVLGRATVDPSMFAILQLIETLKSGPGFKGDARDLALKLKWFPKYIENGPGIIRDLVNINVKVQNERKRNEDERGNKGTFDETKVIESNLPATLRFIDVPVFVGQFETISFDAHLRYDATSKEVSLYSLTLDEEIDRIADYLITKIVGEIMELDLTGHEFSINNARIPIIHK